MVSQPVADLRALTALWLNVGEEELDYIDAHYVAHLAEAEDDSEPGEDASIANTVISTLYYNRISGPLTVNGVAYMFYYRDCQSSPIRRIPQAKIYNKIPTGVCTALNVRQGKMFYYT